MSARALFVGLIALTSASCALRFGSARSEEMRVVVATRPSPTAPSSGFLDALQPDVSLIVTGDRDSAYVRWERQDTASFHESTAPGLTMRRRATETPRGRTLHLIVASAGGDGPASDVVRALLTAVAHDVSHDATVLLALRTTTTPLADSIGALLDPAFAGVARCDDQQDMLAAIRPGALRLYYRPATRVRCDAVRGFESPFPTLLARVELNG